MNSVGQVAKAAVYLQKMVVRKETQIVRAADGCKRRQSYYHLDEAPDFSMIAGLFARGIRARSILHHALDRFDDVIGIAWTP